MIKLFDYTKNQIAVYNKPRIKLWIDELPNIAINDSLFIGSSLSTNSDKLWENKKMVVEVFYGARHNSGYGLLGLELIVDKDKDILEIEVHYNDKKNNHYDETLATFKNYVYSY
jgi:hypothetical protein